MTGKGGFKLSDLPGMVTVRLSLAFISSGERFVWYEDFKLCVGVQGPLEQYWHSLAMALQVAVASAATAAILESMRMLGQLMPTPEIMPLL